MISQLRIATISIALLVLAVLDSDASIRQKKPGQNPNEPDLRVPSKTVWGVAGGFFYEGEVSIDKTTKDTLAANYSLSAFIDFPSRSWGVAGISLETHRVKAKNGDLGKNMIDLSFNLKGDLLSRENPEALKVCLAAGYGHISGQHLGTVFGIPIEIPPTNYIVVKAFLEYSHRASGHAPGLLLQAGFLAAPYGRATTYHTQITAKPRLLMRAGVAFQ